MKVFISHKKEDDLIAKQIYLSLKSMDVESYLDLLEGDLLVNGKRLTEHIKKRLSECSDLLVVLSEKTQYSWWVPFEIGMATQQDYPIVNYLKTGITLPEYLTYWPRLKTIEDLTKYVAANKKAAIEVQLESINKTMHASKETRTDKFYRILKQSL